MHRMTFTAMLFPSAKMAAATHHRLPASALPSNNDARHRASIVLEAALTIVPRELVEASNGTRRPVLAISRIHRAHQSSGRSATVGWGRRIARPRPVISDNTPRGAAAAIVTDRLGERACPRIDASTRIADQLNGMKNRRGLKIGLAKRTWERDCGGHEAAGDRSAQNEAQDPRLHSPPITQRGVASKCRS